MTAVEREPRWFWWPADRLTSRWWPLIMRGGDEWCRRTLGVRLPGGMLFLALWRFNDAKGPCARCGMWEPADAWPDDCGPHCPACHHELADYAAGCICPSYLDDHPTGDETDPWPDPACDYHRDWWREQQAKVAAT